MGSRKKEGRMKKHKKMLFGGVFLVIGLVVVFVMNTSAQTTAKKIDQQLIERPPLGPIPRLCPDLAVSLPNITVQLINGEWWLCVESIVTNKGGKDFISNPGQAYAQLIFKQSWLSGAAALSPLPKIPITRLNKNTGIRLGGSFRLSGYQKPGCTLPPKPGECCREVQVLGMISYDPDILMDGNVNNDDCNAGNNSYSDLPATHVKYTVMCLKKRY